MTIHTLSASGPRSAARAMLPWLVLLLVLALGGCATPPAPYDYSALQRAKPRSLLVLPPINDSPEISATPGAWAHASLPLAEAGYYVLPVTLVDETLRQNGIDSAPDAHTIALDKLHAFFGADAVVYMRVRQYGTRYAVLSSETVVQLEARVVDLRSGELLWHGAGQASSAEQQQQSAGGLIGLLVTALVKQIVGTLSDASYTYAAVASQRLLGAPRFNGLLPGPRSPLYGQPPPARR